MVIPIACANRRCSLPCSMLVSFHKDSLFYLLCLNAIFQIGVVFFPHLPPNGDDELLSFPLPDLMIGTLLGRFRQALKNLPPIPLTNSGHLEMLSLFTPPLEIMSIFISLGVRDSLSPAISADSLSPVPPCTSLCVCQ